MLPVVERTQWVKALAVQAWGPEFDSSEPLLPLKTLGMAICAPNPEGGKSGESLGFVGWQPTHKTYWASGSRSETISRKLRQRLRADTNTYTQHTENTHTHTWAQYPKPPLLSGISFMTLEAVAWVRKWNTATQGDFSLYSLLSYPLNWRSSPQRSIRKPSLTPPIPPSISLLQQNPVA